MTQESEEDLTESVWKLLNTTKSKDKDKIASRTIAKELVKENVSINDLMEFDDYDLKETVKTWDVSPLIKAEFKKQIKKQRDSLGI